MMLCSKTGNECRTEYFEIKNGDRWERCLDCGEHVWAGYIEHNGG